MFKNFPFTALTMPWSFFPYSCFPDITFLDPQIMRGLKFSKDTVYFFSNLANKLTDLLHHEKRMFSIPFYLVKFIDV